MPPGVAAWLISHCIGYVGIIGFGWWCYRDGRAVERRKVERERRDSGQTDEQTVQQ